MVTFSQTTKKRVWTKLDLAEQEHFDYIIPHPKQHDRFLGLDVDANALSNTVPSLCP